MLLLLHIQHRPILEGPLDNIRFGRGALDVLALVQLRPEPMEILKFNEVPDLGEVGVNDGRLSDRSGGWDAGSHGEF